MERVIGGSRCNSGASAVAEPLVPVFHGTSVALLRLAEGIVGTRAVQFGLVVMMAMVTSVATLAPTNAPLSAHDRADSIAPPVVVLSSTDRFRPGDAVAPRPLSEDDEPVVDLYGNNVTSAVARYNLDDDGSLYEAHSPQTQLLRLGSPKS